MNFHQRLLPVPREFRRQSGSGHRVPVVAIATGVEIERPFPSGYERHLLDANEERLSVASRELPVGERPLTPTEGLHRLVGVVATAGLAGKREQPLAAILVGRKTRMLAPDLRRAVVGESVAPAHALRDLADDPPVRLRFAGGRKEGTLAADPPLAVGDGAVLLTPSRGRKTDVGVAAGVGLADEVADYEEFAFLKRVADARGVRQRDGGI